jgi:hypothetical protein
LAIHDRFPETSPYGGKWPDIIPHLSVAWLLDGREFDQVTADFAEAVRGRLPIEAIASEVALMDDSSGGWQVHAMFALGQKVLPPGQN